MFKRMIALGGISIFGLTALVGCATAQQGTLAGAGTGAALGATGGALMARGHSGNGALVGGLIGAVAGGIMGNQFGANNERNTSQDAAINQAMYDANTEIVNVPTSTGGVVPVRIERRGSQWVGPRGEYYNTLPSARDLQPAYGF